MYNEWDKEFEEFEIKFSDRNIYKEEFNKWYFKIFWLDRNEV